MEMVVDLSAPLSRGSGCAAGRGVGGEGPPPRPRGDPHHHGGAVVRAVLHRWWRSPPRTRATTRSTWCWRRCSRCSSSPACRRGRTCAAWRPRSIRRARCSPTARSPWASRWQPGAPVPALVPAVHALPLGAAAAHPLPAAPGQSVGQIEMLIGARGPPPLPLRPCVQPLPLRLLPQGRALPVDLELLVFPEIFPAAGSRPQESDRRGRGRQPPRRLGARPLCAAPLPPGRRPARHPLEADGAHRRHHLHGARGRAAAAGCPSSSTTPSASSRTTGPRTASSGW